MTVFQSISGRLPERERKKREMIGERKNVQTTPIRTNCKCNRSLPNYCQISRLPRNWKFTQHHRTTRPPLGKLEIMNITPQIGKVAVEVFYTVEYETIRLSTCFFAAFLYLISAKLYTLQSQKSFTIDKISSLSCQKVADSITSSKMGKLVPLLSTPCGTTGKDYCYDGCHWITY